MYTSNLDDVNKLCFFQMGIDNFNVLFIKMKNEKFLGPNSSIHGLEPRMQMNCKLQMLCFPHKTYSKMTLL